MTGGPIGRAGIEGLIPHAGRMSLLDAVEQWTPVEIRCTATSHRDPENPLRRDGALHALHLVEYGAQAMAVHGGLVERAAGHTPKPGLLVALRDVKLEVARIDDIEAPLTVHARRLIANEGGWLYAFEVGAAGRRLASGRVSVIPKA